MEIWTARKYLDIGNSLPLTDDIIKRAYYKQALRHHPDKGGDSETFKKIKESYDFLRKNKNDCDGNNGGSNDDGPDDSKHSDIYETYETMLVHFVEYIMKTQKGFENFDPITIKTTLKSIIQGCSSYSIKLFQQLDIEKCRSIYAFLSQYSYLSNLNKDHLRLFEKIMQNKIKNNNVILLNPSLHDLLHDNIYKLETDTDTHYIPLWHEEIVIDDMIVKNIPDIDDNTTITRNNDIIIKHKSSIMKLFKDGYDELNIADSLFKIQSSDVKITKQPQFIVFKNRGKIIPNKHNLYDNKQRGHVIIELTITDFTD
jgi:curved DNA-binding protein CbpA